ncbi:MAG: hypothetical protein ABL966_16395, partial [Acidimicrobiales bacterium]
MMRRSAALTFAVLLLAPAACSDDGPSAGEARLLVDGEAEVERADGEIDLVDGRTDLGPGDRVTMTRGAALMRLAGGTELELREGLADAADTSVLMAERLVLEAGDLLVSAPDSIGLEVDGTDVDVAGGAARLTRAFGMSVAAYDADVALDSAGVAAQVPALRQIVVPDLGRPPRAPRPFDYNPDDAWDRRFLGAAMDLGERLQDLADGLTDILPEGEGRTPGYFRLVLPGLGDEPAFDAELLSDRLDRAPGETLIGAAITDLGERDTFEGRWSEVFEFRDAGAEWGIVALDQAVRSEPLVGSVENALDTSFEQAAAFGEAPSLSPGTAPGSDPGGPSEPGPGGPGPS